MAVEEVVEEVKDEVVGDEESKEGKEANIEGSKQVTPPAKKEAEESDMEAIDPETGIPYKKLYKEHKRKYEKSLEERLKLLENKSREEEIEELTDEEQQITRVLSKQELIDSKASIVADSVLDSLQEEFQHKDFKDPAIKETIMHTIKTLSFKDKLNPQVLKNIAIYAYGARDLIKKDQVPPKKKIVSQKSVGSEVLLPSSKGGASSTVDLPEEVMEYAEYHGLLENFSEEEILDMYKKYRKKK